MEANVATETLLQTIETNANTSTIAIENVVASEIVMSEDSEDENENIPQSKYANANLCFLVRDHEKQLSWVYNEHIR